MKPHTELLSQVSPIGQIQRSKRKSASSAGQSLSARDRESLDLILSLKPYDYIDAEDLHKPDAYEQLFDNAPEIRKPDISWYHPAMDSVVDAKSLGNVGSVILTAAQERVLFFQFNYTRMRVNKILAEAGDNPLTMAQAREAIHWHRRAEVLRDQIAQTNLALVLAMAKRTRISDMDFADLISEGNMALLRAIDKFDAGRGFKFSTYACRAIIKGFSRMGQKQTRQRQMFPAEFDPKMERSDFMEKKRRSHEEDCVDELRDIIRDNKADLTQIEKEVIEHRFGVGQLGHTNEGQALTLEQVGSIIGVTKERVRQIQNRALEKIKQTIQNDFLR
jgi:RNA polymerase sigma factor (sigma-70 family)